MSRASSTGSFGSSRPSVLPTPPSIRPASQTGQAIVSRYAVPRASSVASHRPEPTSKPESQKDVTKNEAEAPKLRRRPSSISAPSIAPRTNRSAALRAAKQEAENQAAAAAAVRKNPRPRVTPPSSFKPIQAA